MAETIPTDVTFDTASVEPVTTESIRAYVRRYNCGDWTKQVADRTELVAAAEEAAEALAGPIL
ncbi:MAG: hypothetical protein V5A21_06725, partial [Halapricum sp.]